MILRFSEYMFDSDNVIYYKETQGGVYVLFDKHWGSATESILIPGLSLEDIYRMLAKE